MSASFGLACAARPCMAAAAASHSLILRRCQSGRMAAPARAAHVIHHHTVSASAAEGGGGVARRRCDSGSAAGIASSSSSCATAAAATRRGYGSSSAGGVATHGKKKGGFLGELANIAAEAEKAEEAGNRVEFTLPLAIEMYPSGKLRAKNKPVGVFDAELARLAAAMFELMYATEGVGLAAPQVGVNYRLMVYNEAGEAGEGKEVVLVNPTITKYSKSLDMFEEGCLSFPKIYADVERPTSVEIEAQDVTGAKFKLVLNNFEARVFQHEYDHLDGVLFHDKMAPEVKATVQGNLDELVAAHPAGGGPPGL
eukprot:CAMPEP_0197575238 /NCGR_PEP_ID=MMETSP1326-20131121/700_1 /TAXON_ID=1155430 /ORGANISM="Genus nov. species nov., Strain RCC2288" /LENGTH=310 /DNA_ID=CAMNT_0043137971 /DNA_START=56 /DNA_END=988 /DNA_ORIENTATION=-